MCVCVCVCLRACGPQQDFRLCRVGVVIALAIEKYRAACMLIFLKTSLFFIYLVRGRANANPHYQKFCARVSHVWGNRRPQPQRSAMPGPHPEGAALLITASPAPGKYEVQSRRSGQYELTEMTYTCGRILQHCHTL